MTPILQILVALGTLGAMGLGAWNAFAKVKTDLALANLRADLTKQLSDHQIFDERALTAIATALGDHRLSDELALAAIRLEMAEKYVSQDALAKTLRDFTKLTDKLGNQVRELQRIVDRELRPAMSEAHGDANEG